MWWFEKIGKGFYSARLLDFPWEATFLHLTSSGIRNNTFKVRVVLRGGIANALAVEILKARQNAKWQPLFPGVSLSPPRSSSSFCRELVSPPNAELLLKRALIYPVGCRS